MPEAPWSLIAKEFTSEKKFESVVAGRITPVPHGIASEINRSGLRILNPAPQVSSRLLIQAARWIDRVPQVGSLCVELMQQMYLLQADEGYDISHSEPQWPRSIFVSIPDRQDSVGALRLAESIVHEVMHLQLTDFERKVTLVENFETKLHSPWRIEHRPVQGVMHGLYVFACLVSFFREIVEVERTEQKAREHSQRRISEIQSEIDEISIEELKSGLTNKGKELVGKWKSAAVSDAS
jgi:HEXXH motif-containing protein